MTMGTALLFALVTWVAGWAVFAGASYAAVRLAWRGKARPARILVDREGIAYLPTRPVVLRGRK